MKQQQIQQLNEIGIALSKEQSIPLLLEKILISAKELTQADGGTIYTIAPNQTLKFEIMVSDTIDVHLEDSFPNISLFLADGKPNESLVVTYSVHHKKTINIKDVYKEKGFDFSGTRQFDEKTGYRTRAVLSVPMKNHEDEVIAVLQLINPTGEVNYFSTADQMLAESLASQAGLALSNQLLIKHLQELFESLIRVISEVIDEKSPSTSNHGKRVPIITALLAQGVNEMDEGPLKKTHFTEKELYELHVATLLHDCGKIATPDHIVEKKTKLEGLYDRIELIEARFEKAHLLKKYKKEQLNEDLAFLNRCNQGKEPMTEEAITRIQEMELLTDDEKKHLSVVKGNLTEQERKLIEHHIVVTYRMLSQLRYPKDLQEVVEIASSHHERIDGTGYPRGLKGNEMSIRARLLAIADVFEALSAPDRPYKKPHPLSEILEIMQGMVEEGHLDGDLFDIFLRKKIYLQYARQYLMSEQIDID